MDTSRLSTSPVLECRADGERRREAVGLLVGERPRSRARLGVAPMPVIGARRPLVAVVGERHERTRDRPVTARERALAHPGGDTPPGRGAPTGLPMNPRAAGPSRAS